jgi:hypothetical protein
MSNVKVTQDQINSILAESEMKIFKIFDKCTVVICKLPNGFIITESSACVDPENFDEVIGYEICMERITNKIWELEGYALQKKVYEDDKA